MNVEDRLLAIDLLHRYGHCYDQGELDAMADCFTEDATFTINGSVGSMPTALEGRPAIRKAMGERRAATAHAQRRHLISNVILDEVPGDPDRIHAASYLLVGSTEDGTLHLPSTGRYTDVLVRSGDGWLIAERVLTLDSTIG
ncbi:nuclear transport factor 2 family protein [Euzebya pacifica]|uniref:nuclear transport factor 2 family protein n=1 Tax=Euzebya pacifica TaxID=1608957 RepID=UPI0030F8BABF